MSNKLGLIIRFRLWLAHLLVGRYFEIQVAQMKIEYMNVLEELKITTGLVAGFKRGHKPTSGEIDKTLFDARAAINSVTGETQ